MSGGREKLFSDSSLRDRFPVRGDLISHIIDSSNGVYSLDSLPFIVRTAGDLEYCFLVQKVFTDQLKTVLEAAGISFSIVGKKAVFSIRNIPLDVKETVILAKIREMEPNASLRTFAVKENHRSKSGKILVGISDWDNSTSELKLTLSNQDCFMLSLPGFPSMYIRSWIDRSSRKRSAKTSASRASVASSQRRNSQSSYASAAKKHLSENHSENQPESQLSSTDLLLKQIEAKLSLMENSFLAIDPSIEKLAKNVSQLTNQVFIMHSKVDMIFGHLFPNLSQVQRPMPQQSNSPSNPPNLSSNPSSHPAESANPLSNPTNPPSHQSAHSSNQLSPSSNQIVLPARPSVKRPISTTQFTPNQEEKKPKLIRQKMNVPIQPHPQLPNLPPSPCQASPTMMVVPAGMQNIQGFYHHYYPTQTLPLVPIHQNFPSPPNQQIQLTPSQDDMSI